MKNPADQGDMAQLHSVLLHAPVGTRGSGAARYGAAMYFYNEKVMPADMLEIYRACSKFDLEDPIDMARQKGVAVPPILLRGDPA